MSINAAVEGSVLEGTGLKNEVDRTEQGRDERKIEAGSNFGFQHVVFFLVLDLNHSFTNWCNLIISC